MKEQFSSPGPDSNNAAQREIHIKRLSGGIAAVGALAAIYGTYNMFAADNRICEKYSTCNITRDGGMPTRSQEELNERSSETLPNGALTIGGTIVFWAAAGRANGGKDPGLGV
ncbi:MAG: hypothetical protein H0W89_07380 [Candidatus Levybacteria bacterium]|nr:hypothetical protein [Candidatus Levybacteria bacterium]